MDDALALLLLSRHPAVELMGVTTGFGNADLATVTRNARLLAALFGIRAPVASGAGRALVRASSPPPVTVHGRNGLGDADLPDPALPRLDPRPAHRLMADVLRAAPGEVTILAVGRLTNLALLLLHDPEAAALARRVVLMGGAFGGAGGNVTPVAEANVLGDPEAAAQVFDAAWDVTAIGLDATREVRLSREEIGTWAASSDPGLALVGRASKLYVDYHARFGLRGCYVHDASAVAYALDPSLFGLTRGPIRVVTGDSIAAGQTVQRDPAQPYPPNPWDDHPNHARASGVDAEGVLQLERLTEPVWGLGVGGHEQTSCERRVVGGGRAPTAR